MQEYENNYQSNPNYNAYFENTVTPYGSPAPTTDRSSTLCFAFGIVSLCMIVGNQFIGLIFGILSLVFHKKVKKTGMLDRNAKEGRIMGLIGTIINGIIAGLYLLYFAFIFLTLFFGLFVEMIS